jgi:hypothetical protein
MAATEIDEHPTGHLAAVSLNLTQQPIINVPLNAAEQRTPHYISVLCYKMVKGLGLTLGSGLGLNQHSRRPKTQHTKFSTQSLKPFLLKSCCCVLGVNPPLPVEVGL